MPFPPRVIFCILYRAHTRVSRPYFRERGYWHSVVCMRIYGVRARERIAARHVNCFLSRHHACKKRVCEWPSTIFPPFPMQQVGKDIARFCYFLTGNVSSKGNWPPHEYRMQANVWQESCILYIYRNFRNGEDLSRGNWAAWIYQISIPSTGKKKLFFKKKLQHFFPAGRTKEATDEKSETNSVLRSHSSVPKV